MSYVVISKDKQQLVESAKDLPWFNEPDLYGFVLPDHYITLEDDSDFYRRFTDGGKTPELKGGIPAYDVDKILIVGDLPDYSFLSCFRNLEVLHIHRAYELRDISFVSELMWLTFLVISYSAVSDIRPVAELIQKQLDFIEEVKGEEYYLRKPGLSHIVIRNSEISDLTCLRTVDLEICDLCFSGNKIEHADALIGKKIQKLDLSNNYIEDAGAMTVKKALRRDVWDWRQMYLDEDMEREMVS